MSKSITASISAAESAIGFDFQFYYFFYSLMGLHAGETIGLEVKDDVHIKLGSGELILMQIKHSLQVDAQGISINLTERDSDLWKTISNWIKIAQEEKASEHFEPIAQFQLISNKSNKNNSFLVKIQSLQDGTISVQDMKKYLTDLAENTDNENIKKYIQLLAQLKNADLLNFIKRIQMELNEDNLIERIKERILEKVLIKDRVDIIYESLHSELRDKSYKTVKERNKLEITFDEFVELYKVSFKKGIPSKLPFREFTPVLPTNPITQFFIRQLLDIRALHINDTDEMLEMTTYMLMMYNHLQLWQNCHEIGNSERKKFDDNSKLLWKHTFQSKFRRIKQRIANGEDIESLEEEIIGCAQECLDELRTTLLKIEDTELDIMLSNGHFYLLNDQGLIGWHLNWETKYSK